jgi:hypothetical protein
MHLGRTIIITSVKQYQQRLARTKSIQNHGTHGLNHSTPAWFDQKQLSILRTKCHSLHTKISTTLDSLHAGRCLLRPAQPPPPSPTQSPGTAPPRMVEVVGMAAETAVVGVQGSRGPAVEPEDANPNG